MNENDQNYYDGLHDFLVYLRDVKSAYQNNMDIIIQKNKETEDVLHQIELGDENEFNNFAIILSTIRKERRVSKDITEECAPLIDYLDSPEISKCFNNLAEILGKMRKIKESHSTGRMYSPRYRNDLTIPIRHKEDSPISKLDQLLIDNGDIEE